MSEWRGGEGGEEREGRGGEGREGGRGGREEREGRRGRGGEGVREGRGGEGGRGGEERGERGGREGIEERGGEELEGGEGRVGVKSCLHNSPLTFPLVRATSFPSPFRCPVSARPVHPSGPAPGVSMPPSPPPFSPAKTVHSQLQPAESVSWIW